MNDKLYISGLDTLRLQAQEISIIDEDIARLTALLHKMKNDKHN